MNTCAFLLILTVQIYADGIEGPTGKAHVHLDLVDTFGKFYHADESPLKEKAERIWWRCQLLCSCSSKTRCCVYLRLSAPFHDLPWDDVLPAEATSNNFYKLKLQVSKVNKRKKKNKGWWLGWLRMGALGRGGKSFHSPKQHGPFALRRFCFLLSPKPHLKAPGSLNGVCDPKLDISSFP